MSESSRAINKPLSVRGKLLKNRVIVSPVSINLATSSGRVTRAVEEFYITLAQGGASLVTLGATAVSEDGKSTSNTLSLCSESHVEHLSKLAEAINAISHSAIQLFHVGPQGNSAHTGYVPRGPSEYLVPDIGELVTTLTEDEVEKLIHVFVNSVLRLNDTAFNFIELHAAHGYLIHSFISPHMNRRKDKFGGSIENRFRFLREVFNRLSKKDNHILSHLALRLSADDLVDSGLCTENLNDWVSNLPLSELAYITPTMGIYESAKSKRVAMVDGRYRSAAKALKSLLPSAVIVSQGGIRTPADAHERLINDGVDLIGIAQAAIADPLWPSKACGMNFDPIVSCTECGRCRYIKRRDLSFDCVRPDTYHPENSIYAK